MSTELLREMVQAFDGHNPEFDAEAWLVRVREHLATMDEALSRDARRVTRSEHERSRPAMVEVQR